MVNFFLNFIVNNCVLHLPLRHLGQHLFSAIIDLLHVLWFTNLGQKERLMEETTTASSTEENPHNSTKCLPLPLINEFLCVASSIIRHLR